MNFTFLDIYKSSQLIKHQNDIFSLFQESFDKELPVELWQWAYLENPAGNPYVSLCYDGDKLAGHYAVIPIVLEQNGKMHLGALSMTTMVGKAYQGKGLFTIQAERVYKMLVADGVEIVIGFPNKNSAPGFKKRLHWTVQDDSRIVTMTGAEIKNSPQIKNTLNRADNLTLNLSESYLDWRMRKPGAIYEKVSDDLIIKTFNGTKDIVYMNGNALPLLVDEQEYNLFVESVEAGNNSEDGFSYKFGYRTFTPSLQIRGVKVDLLMSDVF